MVLTCILTRDTDLYADLPIERYVEAVVLDEYAAGGGGDEESSRIPVREQRQRRVSREAERHESRRPEKHGRTEQ